MCSTKILLMTIFNEIKCHVNNILSLVGECIPLCPRLVRGLKGLNTIVKKRLKSDALYVSFKLTFQSNDNARILLILCSKYI